LPGRVAKATVRVDWPFTALGAKSDADPPEHAAFAAFDQVRDTTPARPVAFE
jgi:hypothetical protein